MRTLLIDNHDSFTFNLAQLIGEVVGVEPLVVANDAAAWDELPVDEVDAIVLSPGPGRPERRRDVGLSLEAVRRSRIPVLGVCLGHQTIAHALGGRVTHAPAPIHGGVWQVHHDGWGLLAGLPTPFAAVRYHSLHVVDLPPVLEVTARTRDGVVMAIAHRTRPLWGVQFHPESVCTDHGRHLVANLRAEVENWWQRSELPPPAAGRRRPRMAATAPGRRATYRVHAREVARGVDAEAAFAALYADAPDAFWLDSASAADGRGRWSYLGDASGPHAETVTYDVARREVRVRTATSERSERTDILAYLERELGRRSLDPATAEAADFPLVGGYVGYLGYEVRRDTGSQHHRTSDEPDAAFVFADRYLVVDQHRDVVWAVALSRPGTHRAAAAWLDATADRLAAVGTTPGARAVPSRAPAVGDLPVRWRHGPERYLELIHACQHEIRDGESYELCLTDTATVDVDVDPVTAYGELRRVNPAPYGALLRFCDTAVLSSSPERFLRITADRRVEARPIKGTRPRAEDPRCDAALHDDLATSPKDRAENLMIVDLLRNDLGSVCEVGSVAVPGLFEVESYATVHQLVSTIGGRLRSEVTVIDCVRAAFPGGSMTGAPKLRSMEILDRLEAGPRGVYSGALGFASLTGEVDLSIVIRTLVVRPGRVTFGVGGAILALSDPCEEVAEVATKARPLLAALARSLDAAPVPAGEARARTRVS